MSRQVPKSLGPCFLAVLLALTAGCATTGISPTTSETAHATVAGRTPSPTATPSPTTTSAPTASPTVLPSPLAGGWESAGRLHGPRLLTQAVLLGDGRVLVVGNAEMVHSTGGVGDETRSVEIWEPATGAWRKTEPLAKARGEFAAVTLADGRAMIVGGINEDGAAYSSAYIFDPGTERWSKTGLMHTARVAPAATLLNDGRVLVAGGRYSAGWWDRPRAVSGGLAGSSVMGLAGAWPRGAVLADVDPGPPGRYLATAELFDPRTGSWSETGAMRYAFVPAAAATLGDGRALVCGTGPAENIWGPEFEAVWQSCEVYDPTTGSFSLIPVPTLDRADLERRGVAVPYGWGTDPEEGWIPQGVDLVALDDGGALLVHRSWRWPIAVVSYLRLKPGATSWQQLGDPMVSLHDWSAETDTSSVDWFGGPHPTAIVASLGDGRVLLAGGRDEADGAIREAEVLDLATVTWSSLPPMPEARAFARSVPLDDGSVLIIGGDWSGDGEGVRSTFRFVPER